MESEPGQGARFEIFWPAVQGESAADGPVAVANAGEGGGGARILLVEDESMLRRGLGRALRTSGYSVVEAADGESALELIASSEEGFDLVATDVMMPGMDGISLSERVRALQPGVKELVFSGHVGRTSGRLYTIDPGIPLLRKPFGPEEMVAKIREVLEARADADGSSAVPKRRTA